MERPDRMEGPGRMEDSPVRRPGPLDRLRGFRVKASIAFLHDLAMALLAFGLALYLREGSYGLVRLERELPLSLGVYMLCCGAVFLLGGLYRGIWRYASLNDLAAIVRAVTVALAVFLLITFMMTRLEAYPRSALAINWFVLCTLLAGPRLLYQLFKYRSTEHLMERDAHLRVPVLLIGAGDEADEFIRNAARDRHAPYEVVGIVDVKGKRVGRSIRNVPVLGRLDELDLVAESAYRRSGRRPQRLVLTRPLGREALTRLLAYADASGMTLAHVPRLSDLSGGEDAALRPVALEDLLRRPQTVLDPEPPRRLVGGRRVLITGAGGSIGSELVRQVAELEPARLVLLEASEFNLYTIDRELAERHPGLARGTRIADVRDAGAIEAVFAEEAPELVLHAAALKHVPLVEENPEEGVLTNTLGTRIVADACRRHGVGTMVQVSTDKAINPSSVMGASKRLAESYCQALDLAGRASGDGQEREQEQATHFVTVRFGNVLGSTGSVVPLFQRQLAGGGPLTVTHPDMTRYFMTIREAVRLILQAAALGTEAAEDAAGRIFVLDMGKPIRIVELAEQMIRLAGKKPYEEVGIVFTGLRPGEKLFEELFHDAEPPVPTGQPGLLLAAPRTADPALLGRALDELAEAARARDRATLLALLARLVPEATLAEATLAEATLTGQPAEPRDADSKPAAAQ